MRRHRVRRYYREDRQEAEFRLGELKYGSLDQCMNLLAPHILSAKDSRVIREQHSTNSIDEER